jgi:hypothetical protein
MVPAIAILPKSLKSPQKLVAWPGAPVESPTVPKAEVASKRVVRYGVPSVTINIRVITTTKIKERLARTNASLRIFCGSRRPIRLTSRSPRRLRHRATRTVPKVVVLIPPPVPPGDAPTNIRRMKTKSVTWCRDPISSVLNPAVRGVTT